jgi:hypothetical protein
MKKLAIIVAFIILALVKPAFSEEKFCADLGRFEACVPIASGLSGAFGYDFRGHRSQGLGETKVGSVRVTKTSKLLLKAGIVTSDDSKGAPFAGFDYELESIENPIPWITIQPGLYGGKDFRNGDWFYGFKASIPVVK